MKRLRLAIVGWGRLGRACAESMSGMEDLALAGVVVPPGQLALSKQAESRAVLLAGHISELGPVDIALLCVPGTDTAGVARELLQARVPLVECADLEGEALQQHQQEIAHWAGRHRVAAVVGAGWDAGVRAQLQRLFDILIPHGRSLVQQQVAAPLHHTAAAEGLPGVRGALCTELPEAAGQAMRRYIYVELDEGADIERVRELIAADPLFAQGSTQVLQVPDISALDPHRQGWLIERLQEHAGGPHASLLLEARIDPVVATARLMIDAARALPGHAGGGWRYGPAGLVPLDVGTEARAEPHGARDDGSHAVHRPRDARGGHTWSR